MEQDLFCPLFLLMFADEQWRAHSGPRWAGEAEAEAGGVKQQDEGPRLSWRGREEPRPTGKVEMKRGNEVFHATAVFLQHLSASLAPKAVRD